MIWTDDAIERFDDADTFGIRASVVFAAGLTAERFAARDFRDYVTPEDVDRAIELARR